MATFVQNMSVNHGRADVFVPKKFLDGPNVVASLKQVGSERMPERVAPNVLDYPSLADCLLHRPLENRLMDMMAAFFAELRLARWALPGQGYAQRGMPLRFLAVDFLLTAHR